MKKTLMLCAAIAATGGANAQLVTYTIPGSFSGTETSIPAGSTNSNVTVTAVTRGSGLTGNAGGGSFNSAGWSTGTTLSGALGGNDSITFTITPAANYSLSFTGVTTNARRSSTGPSSLQWTYSANSFGSGLGSPVSAPTSGSSAVAATLSNTGVTTSTEFRLAGWNASGATGTARLLDAVTLNGSATLRAASTLTWDGGQGANWNAYNGTAANQSSWNGNNTPAAALQDSLAFAGSTQTTTNNNISGLTVNTISFASGAAAFTNSGNGVTLTGGITNNSSNTQTINHGLTLSSGTRSVNAVSGNIVLGGNLSGAGAIDKVGANALTLTGTNSHSGGLTVSEGTVNANSTSALGTGVTLVDGGTLRSSGNLSNLGDLTLANGILNPGGSSAASLSLGTGSDFVMTGGVFSIDLDLTFDFVAGTFSSSFTITGGELALNLGDGFDYGFTYQLFSGFGSGSVSDLLITGYDDAVYTATLNDAGVLSFSTAVPEPHEYALATGLLLLTVIAFRRRKLATA